MSTYYTRLNKALTENELGKLYETLTAVFPRAEDPSHFGGGVTPRMDACRVRDSIPGLIASRGTETCCRELIRLTDNLPQQATILRWHYRDAVTNIRRTLWAQPSPEVLKKLLIGPKGRMITCDDDLSELILESLGRLQARLTKHVLPSAEELWRWDGSGLKRSGFRPKDEESLSDYIARWITQDIGPNSGVVVNREVQLRRGARTDIIVEATIPNANNEFEKLTVILEVKGCWHKAVRAGLKTQLVDGYLSAFALRCGIYLVGWFVCEQWENAENHLKSNSAIEAVCELEELASTFDGVKTDFRVAPYLLDCTLPSTKAPSAR